MGRGLDGLIPVCWLQLCSFEGPRRRKVLTSFRWLWRAGNTSSHSEQSSQAAQRRWYLARKGPGE